MTDECDASERLTGVWSATPTPFTADRQVDTASVARLVAHHLRLGVRGLFLCGTCGEGPWLTDEQRQTLVASVAQHAAGRLVLAVQVTDNSALRILDNMHRAKEAGADIAVVGPPFFLANDTLENIIDLYMEAVRNSPLPVGIYDRGRHSQVVVPCRALEKIYAEPNVVLVKDSSLDTERMKLALAVRKQRQGLYLLNGYEFDCISYLEAGYDGLLLGGGIFNGHLARQIFTAVRAGHAEEARHLQERMNRLMWDVYGGKDLTCWLAGEKELLVQMGVFSTTAGHLRYPLTKACVRAIRKALKRDADVLFPEPA